LRSGNVETSKCGAFILALLKQVGKPYSYGAEVALDDPNPERFDCAELPQWGLAQVDITRIGRCPIEIFDPAWRQYDMARSIPIDVARNHIGSLVFVQGKPERPHGISHVGIVIAKDTIVEARGKDYGVVCGAIRPSFTLAAKVDELYEPCGADYTAPTSTQT
jgi:cell wall-associated NlpC family hydrolase